MFDFLRRLNRWQTAAVSLAAFCVVGLSVASYLLAPRDSSASTREVVIPQGTGAAGVARILQREGIIRHWAGLSVYTALTGQAQALQAGRYALCPCWSVPVIADAIVSGRAISDDIFVTIPEGVNIWELDAIFLKEHLISRSGQFSRVYGGQEGKLFPETYRFAKDATIAQIAARMGEEFAQRVDSWSFDEIVVASILEKEAKSAEDMALVAGIIRERMRRGMPLQVDATVAYGWCMRTAGYALMCDVTQAPIATELKVDGPYNTYARTGLPAGPISNPGLKALTAAAHPKESPYLYYLSTRDGLQMIYSKTLDEHLRNRAKYLGF